MRRTIVVVVLGLVLCLGSTAGAEGDGATVDISNQAYTPIVATISAGGTVTWVNSDEETHSVFIEAVGSDHLLLPGTSYAYSFGDAGEFTYHCSLHSHAGKIVVTAAVATTAPPPSPPTPKPAPTTVAPTTVPATVTPTVAATNVSPSTLPVTTEPSTTTTVSRPTTVVETTLGSPVAVTVTVEDGGGLPSGALIGGGGAGAALGVVAGYLLKRRMSRRAAGVA